MQFFLRLPNTIQWTSPEKGKTQKLNSHQESIVGIQYSVLRKTSLHLLGHTCPRSDTAEVPNLSRPIIQSS